MDKYIFYTIFFLYITWIILLILGMIWIIKYNLWKPENYWTISIIIFTYIIIFYQIRIMYICYPYFETPSNKNMKSMEGYSNSFFNLYDRRNELPSQIKFSGNPSTIFDWSDPLKFGANTEYNVYNSDTNTVCKTDTVIQLTELASVATQQMQDASAAYYSLVGIYKTITGKETIPSTCA